MSCLSFSKIFFSLPQLFVFLFDVLSVAVFVIRDRFVKKPMCLNLYPCVIKYYLSFLLLFSSFHIFLYFYVSTGIFSFGFSTWILTPQQQHKVT